MSRLSGMVNGTTTMVDNVTYDAANALLTMTDETFYSPSPETRQYNVLGQLTSISMTGMVNLQYTYPAQNAGQISKMKDLLSPSSG